MGKSRSPDAEGLYVRGAVKARRPLMNGLKDKLEAVNDLSTVRSNIYNVFDKTLQRFDVLAAGRVLSVAGYDILAFYTRSGHGEGYRVVRVSRKIRAVSP